MIVLLIFILVAGGTDVSENNTVENFEKLAKMAYKYKLLIK